MRIHIKLGTSSVEIDPAIFTAPEAVDRWIKALQIAKKTVWPEEDKKK